jgi:hypothetical protein
MFRQFKLMAMIGILTVGALGASRAMAEFVLGGYTPQVVWSQQGLENAAVSLQTTGQWASSGSNTGYVSTASFESTACDSIAFARLYVDIYGGTNLHTTYVTVTVNGHALSTIYVGGTSDSNSTFDATSTCVYGSGVGQWQLAIAGADEYLHTDGTANVITVTEDDKDGTNFDGRIVDISLVTVYQDSSIDQALDYYLIEGDGYMRKSLSSTYGNAPSTRTVAIDGIDTSNVTSASYTTLYTHGSLGEADRQYFNGNQLGGDDVAYGQYGTYGPDLTTFDVTAYLAEDSSVVYNASGETSMLAKLGLLSVTHAVPEPATLTLLAIGAMALIRRKRTDR